MKEEILRLLRSADGYISGQELCNRFGVSRTAVWKAINQLKEAGYEIEAQQNKGYRLMAAPDLMTEAEIKSLMHTDWVAKEVLYFDTIDSTNIKAQELAEKRLSERHLSRSGQAGVRQGAPWPQLGIAVRHRYFHDTYDKA